MAPDKALAGQVQPFAARPMEILLEPLSHPELGAIRIDDNLFAIGRTEPPFAGYPPEVVADLSRRHARIFIEGDAAFIADLGSKNGTSVNGAPVTQAILRLQDGDALELSGGLSYRVRLQAGEANRAPPARLASVTLEPQDAGSGLQSIVITRFPFLISKVDPTFTRYRDVAPEQVGYLSRRHAHIFLKGGLPYVEDLGSTNGTFIGAARLDEHAHELKEGDVLAFGGHHFVYRVSLQWEQATPEPTVTRVALPHAAGEADKTTFVAAPGSFLDIFCVDQAAAADDALNPAQESPAPGAAQATPRKPQGRYALMLAGLLEAAGAAGDSSQAKRLRRWMLAAAGVVVVLALLIFAAGAPERELKGLVADGQFDTAATLAAERLARDPGNAEIRALGTEALFKARLPRWIAHLRQHRFDQAAAELARMRVASRNNADARPLVAEVGWIGELEQFVAGRGGAEAPLQGPADQARVRQFLKRWQDDQQAHQRAFATISSMVPEFRDTYAKAVSDLRKLALAGGNGGNDQ